MSLQGNSGSEVSQIAAHTATTPRVPTAGTKSSAYAAMQPTQTAAGATASPPSTAVSATSLQPSAATAGAAGSPAALTGPHTAVATASGSDTEQSQTPFHSVSRDYGEDDDDDFGDFGGAAAAAVPGAVPAAAAVPQSTAAHAAAGQGGDDDDDDFGDFDAAPTGAAAITPGAQAVASLPNTAAAAGQAQTAAVQADNDDFGDFGHASAATTPPAAATVAGGPARAAAVQMAAQPPAVTAVPEGPDVLALSGADFLSAVLDAWQVLGAPAGYKAAAAHQPQQDTRSQHQQQQHCISASLPWASESSGHSISRRSIMVHNGIPLRLLQIPASLTTTSSNSNGPGLAEVVEVPQQLSCSSNLEWSGSASEARLVDGLGLRQAVERALAAQGQHAGKRTEQRRQQQREAVG